MQPLTEIDKQTLYSALGRLGLHDQRLLAESLPLFHVRELARAEYLLRGGEFHAMPSAELLWNAVKPAVIAADPVYAGDEAGFCAAYGSNQYAPDLR